MKKSLLVVPALGVMLLAAAGSVGGTVAWFSSVSSVEASVGIFQSTALDGNLGITVTKNAEKGTRDHSDLNTIPEGSVAVEAGAYLTHASYDHTNGVLSTRSSETESGVREVDAWKSTRSVVTGTAPNTVTHPVYYAVSWNVSFTFAFANEQYVNLYFDPNSSLIEFADADANTQGDQKGTTYYGFRVAFVPTNGNDFSGHADTRVWAPERKANEQISGIDTSAFAFSYVHSTGTVGEAEFENDAYTGGAYGSNVVLSTKRGDENALAYTKYDEGGACPYDLTKGSLGQFKNDANGKTISFTCVAWFEGTDASIRNYDGLLHSAMSANMKFYTREAAAAYTGA